MNITVFKDTDFAQSNNNIWFKYLILINEYVLLITNKDNFLIRL